MSERRSIWSSIKAGVLPQGYELKQSDVGRIMELGSGFGRVLKNDVGKRVWVKSYGLVMENDEQRDARKGRKNPHRRKSSRRRVRRNRRLPRASRVARLILRRRRRARR